MSLRLKLMISFLAVGLVPLAVLAVIALNEGSQGLQDKSYQQLAGIRDMKKAHISDYIRVMQDQLMLVRNDPTLAEAMERFGEHFEGGQPVESQELDESLEEGEEIPVALTEPGTINDAWEGIAEEYDDHLSDVMLTNGWYDLVLVNEKGQVMYTVAREDDLGENLNSTALRDSSFADAFQQVKRLDVDEIAISDFKPYGPSDDAPAGFMLTKMPDQLCYVGLRIPLDKINAIMVQRAGMGETGESYLVGPDLLMRSDSFRDPEYHKVLTSFLSPQKGKVDTNAVREALAGNQGIIATREYDGTPVLTAFAPFKLGEAQWALLAVVEEAEAYSVVQTLKYQVLMVAGIGVFFMVAMAWLISKGITLPVTKTMEVVKAMSDGDLTQESNVHKKDEIGVLAMSVDRTVRELRKIISGVAEDSHELSNSSRDLSATSDNMAVGAQMMREKANEAVEYGAGLSREIGDMANTANSVSTMTGNVYGSVEEITVGISDVAKQCVKGAEIANTANEKGKKASELMAQLNAAAKRINEVTDIIGGIAKRTNLLALNATIESASAGEAGKGFAVVAQEVKDLAKQSASATEQIAEQIQGIQDTAQFSVAAIEEITSIIEEMRGISQAIEHTMESQSQKVVTISQSMNQASQSTRQLAEKLEVSASKSQSFAESIGEVNAAAMESTDGATQTNDSAKKLAGMAVRLKEVVERFKVQ